MAAKPSVLATLQPPPGVGADRMMPADGAALEKASASLEAVVDRIDWPKSLAVLARDEAEADAGKAAPAPVEAVKLYAMARHAAESRQWAGALESLNRAIRLDPAAAAPRLLVGRIHAKLGRRASAIEALTAAVQRDPDNAEALYLLGRMSFEKREYEPAVGLLHRSMTRAAAISDRDVTYLASYFLGQSLLRLDRDAAAAAALQRFLDQPRRLGRSEWFLRDLVLVTRQRELAKVQLGDALMRLGRPGEAIERYAASDLAERLGPAFVAGREVYASMLLGRSAAAMDAATDAYQKADEDEAATALSLIQYVIKHASDRSSLTKPLRAAYAASDRAPALALAMAETLAPPAAGQWLAEHLQHRPDDRAVLRRLGRLWGVDSAERLMRLAIDMLRRQPQAAEALSEALLEAAAQPSRWVEAIDALPAPESSGPASDYLRGRLLAAAGREAEARQRFEAAMDASPQFLDARLAAVELLLDRAAEVGSDRLRARFSDRALAWLEAAGTEDDQLKFLQARALTLKGAFGEAAGVLQPLLRADRDRPAYLELKARILREVGRFDQAERTLVQLVKSWPQRVSAYRALFELYERHRPDPQKFAELVERAEATMPGGRLTRLKKARLLDMQGRRDEAIPLLRELVREDPDDGEALAAYTVAVGRSAGWADAAAKLEALLDADPSNEAALTMLESVAQLLGEPERFYKRYEASLAGKPRSAQTLGRLAALYEQWGKLDKAIAALEEALGFEPASPGPFHLHAARLHQRAGRLSAALGAMEKAIAASPDDPHYAVVKAWLLQEAGRVADAVAVLEAAEQDHPDASADLRLERARVYAASDRHAQAMALMDKLIADHPDRAAELYYMQSLLPGGRGTAAQTEKLLLKSLEADPGYAPANNDLGYTWADAGRNLKQAERMVRKAVEADPNNAAYLDSLGWVLYKRDLPEQAVRWLRRAAELRGGDAVILDHLGDAYWRAGEREQAASQWRTARERIIDAGGDLSETEAELLSTLQSKLEAVQAGRAPAVAPIARPERIDAGASAVSPAR